MPVHTSAVTTSTPTPVTIAVNAEIQVSGLWQRPSRATSSLVLAHGAGAGMDHPFMADLARDLAGLGLSLIHI